MMVWPRAAGCRAFKSRDGSSIFARPRMKTDEPIREIRVIRGEWIGTG